MDTRRPDRDVGDDHRCCAALRSSIFPCKRSVHDWLKQKKKSVTSGGRRTSPRRVNRRAGAFPCRIVRRRRALACVFVRRRCPPGLPRLSACRAPPAVGWIMMLVLLLEVIDSTPALSRQPRYLNKLLYIVAIEP